MNLIPIHPQGNWLSAPRGPIITQPHHSTNRQCLTGIQYLRQINQLLVHQKVEILEAVLGCETNNKYEVKNIMGQMMFLAKEQNDCCIRMCCGPMRPFEMSIYDNFENEVIHLYRRLACQSCCFPCCLQFMEVSSPPGMLIGTIEQEWSIIYPRFRVLDSGGNVVLLIKGPLFSCGCCDVDFKILSKDGKTEVGKICKQWGGLLREVFTDADNFGVTFPMDLDEKMKAVLLGACFLIDFMYFENSNEGALNMLKVFA